MEYPIINFHCVFLLTGFVKLLAVNIAAISVKFPEFGGYASGV